MVQVHIGKSRSIGYFVPFTLPKIFTGEDYRYYHATNQMQYSFPVLGKASDLHVSLHVIYSLKYR